MDQSVNWFAIYHDVDEKSWNSAKGLIEALKDLQIKIYTFSFQNPEKFKLPDKKYFIDRHIKVVLSFYAGKSTILEEELKRLKKELSLFLVSELGDEPQTLINNNIRAEISDLSLSPDKKCSLYWQNQGHNCLWFTHWADTKIFKFNPIIKKKYFIVTTMGKRKYNFLLKLLLGNKYLNKRVNAEENTVFYNSGKVVYQYARWGEITRRIFEAAACKCCILTNKLEENTGIETIFAHNVSAIYFEGPLDLIYQVIRLYFKPKLRKLIADNAYQIVIKNHTEKVRAKYLLDNVENLIKNNNW